MGLHTGEVVVEEDGRKETTARKFVPGRGYIFGNGHAGNLAVGHVHYKRSCGGVGDAICQIGFLPRSSLEPNQAEGWCKTGRSPYRGGTVSHNC